MKNTMLKFLGIALAAIVILPVARAQTGSSGMGQGRQSGPPPPQTPPTAATPTGAADAAEEAAFKKLVADVSDPKLLVPDSKDFLKKYPNSRYASQVYAQLAGAYVQQGDAPSAGAAARKAVELNPNSPDALPILALVSSHEITETGQVSVPKIKATEDYARQGIQLLNTLQKPPDATDADFSMRRDQKLAMCHSAMGLAYLYESKGTQAVQELSAAVKLETPPEPQDMYLYAVALDAVGQDGPAITQLEGACPKLSGEMQQRCISFMADVKRKAPGAPKQ